MASEANQPQLSPSMELSMFRGPTPGIFQDKISSDQHFIVMNNMTTMAAFAVIGQTLEMRCIQDTGFYLSTVTCDLPPTFIPTLQQQIIPHKPYVDMLPWPSMRDRILTSLQAINDQELILDMMFGDVKVWGSTPWEVTGWEIGPEFAKKWWFLIDDGIRTTTNFWRAQRGEPALKFGPP